MGTRAKVRKVRKIPPLIEEETEKEKVPEYVPVLQPKGNVA